MGVGLTSQVVCTTTKGSVGTIPGPAGSVGKLRQPYSLWGQGSHPSALAESDSESQGPASVWGNHRRWRGRTFQTNQPGEFKNQPAGGLWVAERLIYLGATGGTLPAGVLEPRLKPWNVLGPRIPEWSSQANTEALALGQLPLGERGDRKKGNFCRD